MKIGIISESPSATTGFGTTCRCIASAIQQANHDVVCFGINAFGETFDRSAYPYKIWAVGNRNLIEALSEFLIYEQLDVIFISFDVLTLERWYKIVRSLGWKGPVIGYFVADCLPIYQEYIDIISELEEKITPTNTVANYLNTKGIGNIRVAPHGVDRKIFSPLADRDSLRNVAGLESKFLIGVFGRNGERKQQTRVMQALSALKKRGLAEDLVLYLHCQRVDDPVFGGWDLLQIARNLEIDDLLIHPDNNYKQTSGIPYLAENDKPKLQFDDFSYVERMNCCDLIINPAFCGGFELVILEAQSCGVPIATTNDSGNMAEVAGDGAILMTPIDTSYWKLGGLQFWVSFETIAETILSVKQNRPFKKELISKGFLNASRYSWVRLTQQVQEAVNSVQAKIQGGEISLR